MIKNNKMSAEEQAIKYAEFVSNSNNMYKCHNCPAKGNCGQNKCWVAFAQQH